MTSQVLIHQIHFGTIQFFEYISGFDLIMSKLTWASRQCAEELSPSLATLNQTNSCWHLVSKSSSRNLTNKISIHWVPLIHTKMTRPKNIAACVEEYFQGPDAKDASKSSKTTTLEESYEENFRSNSTEESLV